jgi:hypothetical protein
MAKRGGKGRKGKGKSTKGKKGKKGSVKAKSNHIPLAILEKRLGKLNRVVTSRGGSAY